MLFLTFIFKDVTIWETVSKMVIKYSFNVFIYYIYIYTKIPPEPHWKVFDYDTVYDNNIGTRINITIFNIKIMPRLLYI